MNTLSCPGKKIWIGYSERKHWVKKKIGGSRRRRRHEWWLVVKIEVTGRGLSLSSLLSPKPEESQDKNYTKMISSISNIIIIFHHMLHDSRPIART